MTCKQCIHRQICPYCLNAEDAEKCKQFVNKDEYVRIKISKAHKQRRNMKTIGDIIYEKRKIKGLTQKKLAEKIDSCQGTIASWEHGDAYPNALFLASLADVFECTTDEICGR